MKKDNNDLPNTNTNKRKVVFILSETRSGSTWLSYVLGSHTRATHLGEYHRLFTTDSPNRGCRLCQAKGRTECEYLHGFDKIEKECAYDFAFERFQTAILIDSSKQLDWLLNFVDAGTFQVKIIHLLRDPRGWFASEKRRNKKICINNAMNQWVNTNDRIDSKLAELSLPYTTAFYDELSMEPDLYFIYLCEYIGILFEKNALNYWISDHHGLGGNGAAFNNIRFYPQAKIRTEDDEYYKKMYQKKFHDSRWLKELRSVERNTLEEMSIVNEYLHRHDRSFAHFDKLLGGRKSQQNAPGDARTSRRCA